MIVCGVTFSKKTMSINTLYTVDTFIPIKYTLVKNNKFNINKFKRIFENCYCK